MPNYPFLRDKVILITGGSGSFGQMAARILLTLGFVRKVIIFSRDEWKQWEMRKRDPLFNHPSIRYFLGDVRDEQRLLRAFHEVDYVIHAAALKQVPAAEYNPTEFVKTNIGGATHVVNAAITAGVRGVAALSTDKAVNPINLYGATKLCAEKLFTAAHSYVGGRGEPRFCVVRYGNVLGSRGSVIPFWQQLIAEGTRELPVTDLRMTRFWISLEQSVHFVLASLGRMQGGELFIPKIPSMRIADMAECISPTGSYRVMGIRPGEKLHEILISADEGHHCFEGADFYLIVPETRLQESGYLEQLRTISPELAKVPDSFVYASHTNEKWMDGTAFHALLSSLIK